MKSETSKTKARLAVLLLSVAVLPAYAGDVTTSNKETPMASFKAYDTNKDGHLSLEEFKAKGKDNLAFKAADINGDERVDPSEYDKYRKAKATDQPRSESEAAEQPKPAQPSAPKPTQPPTGY